MLITILYLARRNSIGKKYDSNNYFAAVIDKDSLIRNTPSPRIILGGASNLAFGIDSKMMQDTFGIPVINMGLHGNFGIDFILNQIRANARKGDVVVLSLEYYLDEMFYKDIDYVLNLYPEAGEYVNRGEDYYTQKAKYFVSESQDAVQKQMNTFFDKVLNFKEAKVFVSDQLHSYDTLIYSRSAFNSNGDVISHLGKKYPYDLRGRTPIEVINYSRNINKLNDFAGYIESLGGKVFLTYASYPQSEFNKYKDAAHEFDKTLKDGLKFKIISKPEELVFADSLFFDTVYHLNEEGRHIRTADLIKKLKGQEVLNRATD